MYNRHFRGFQLNPESVCSVVPPKRRELTAPDAWRSTVPVGTPMHGVVVVTGSDLRRAGTLDVPEGVDIQVIETPLADVILFGIADASNTRNATLDDHHSTPIRGDLDKVRAHRRFMRHRGGGVDLQPRLARFYIGDTAI